MDEFAECFFIIFFIFFSLSGASFTSSTSLAIVAEMQLSRLANSGLEEKLGCPDLSESTAADTNSFAEDPSRHFEVLSTPQISGSTPAKPPLSRVAGVGCRAGAGLWGVDSLDPG